MRTTVVCFSPQGIVGDTRLSPRAARVVERLLTEALDTSANTLGEGETPLTPDECEEVRGLALIADLVALGGSL